MNRKTIAMLLSLMLLAAMLIGCGNGSKIVTEQEALEIALEELGIRESDASDIHTHVVEEQSLPCYSFHITTQDGEYSVIIDAATGKVVK